MLRALVTAPVCAAEAWIPGSAPQGYFLRGTFPAVTFGRLRRNDGAG